MPDRKPPNQEELIQATSLKLNINQFAVEKDLFVTKAISVLIGVKDDNFKLVFQGGTALAKAHRFVLRMSEDCDFRLAYKIPQQQRKKDAQRRLLRGFRKNLLKALADNGFEFDQDAIKVRNEGQFISVRARYPSLYQAPNQLKAYLALEFFLGQVKTPVAKRKITLLIRQTLGDQIDHPEVEVTCMSIAETAAEKWVALTRRVATAQEREHYYDQALVRHIYDLAMINRHCPLKEGSFAALAAQIVETDKKHFKTHSDLCHQNPIGAIEFALSELATNPVWKQNWQAFMDTMVYGDKPTYGDALKNLESLSKLALYEIKLSGYE